jgi:Domain of unknown function (DUF4375)
VSVTEHPPNDSEAGDASGYWRLLEPYWEVIDIYDGPERFLETYASVPAIPRTLFAAHFCESEASNGGLHQFFSNPTGVLAPEAVEAFRRIGFEDAAAILERAMKFFGTPYPREQVVRVERLNSRQGSTRQEWDPFYGLDEEFYHALGPEHAPFFDALDRLAESGEGSRPTGG